jgi:hypothetical protein
MKELNLISIDCIQINSWIKKEEWKTYTRCMNPKVGIGKDDFQIFFYDGDDVNCLEILIK